jgi:hypothetical protein
MTTLGNPSERLSGLARARHSGLGVVRQCSAPEPAQIAPMDSARAQGFGPTR